MESGVEHKLRNRDLFQWIGIEWDDGADEAGSTAVSRGSNQTRRGKQVV